MSNLVIERVSSDSIDRFQPLWLALREHHAELEPARRVQQPDRSWELRRAVYVSILTDARSFGLVAMKAGRDVGYAVVAIHDGPDELWVTGNAIAEVETLCVAASHRGDGVGGLLLDRVEDELALNGIRDLQIACLATNEDALRFYERRGLAPRLVVLSRFV